MPNHRSQPLTLDALQDMMKDPRYWDANHPERDSWSALVTNGFQTLFPDVVQRDETGRQTDEANAKIVHVRAYTRKTNDEPINVSEHNRSAPTHRDHSTPSDPNTRKLPTAPSGASIDANINEALRHAAFFPWDDWWFFGKVRNKGPWDYKQIGPDYRDFGNFNFGATGAAMGYSEDTLLRMAGWAQIQAGTSRSNWGSNPGLIESFLGIGGIPPFGDDPDDQIFIKFGIEYLLKGRR